MPLLGSSVLSPITHYWEAMRRFPTPPNVTADVDTDFGMVRVYEWHTPETRDSMPVMLIPGRSSGAPIWADNLVAFSSHHPVVVFDALGDAGLSVQAAPLTDMADQAARPNHALLYGDSRHGFARWRRQS